GSVLAALQQITQQRPDIIFSDLEMPGATGRQLAAYLKTSTSTACIPIVICTYSRTEEIHLLSADTVLRRPVTSTMIKSTMLKLNARRAA
ncbi:MAG: response regulator, partial [Planctomycetota bacterium]